MEGAVIAGPRVYLRPIRDEDAGERYLGWLCDPEVVKYLEARHQTHTLESVARFVSAHTEGRADPLFAICLREGDRHIGNIKLGPVDRPNGSAWVGLLIGERDCWGQGYATESIALTVAHAFGPLGLRRLSASAYAVNVGSIRAFERCGFAREGALRGAALFEGAPMDVVLMGKLRG